MPNKPYLNEQPANIGQLVVTVRNREKIFFNGPARAITSYNANGKFDILSEHVNFISIIKTGVIIYKMDGTTQDFKISTGIIKVSSNTVNVFLGILTPNPAEAKA